MKTLRDYLNKHFEELKKEVNGKFFTNKTDKRPKIEIDEITISGQEVYLSGFDYTTKQYISIELPYAGMFEEIVNEQPSQREPIPIQNSQ